MPGNDDKSTEYLITLLPEQNERLERLADCRASFGCALEIKQIIVEAVDEYLDHKERPRDTRQDQHPNRKKTLFHFLFGDDPKKAFQRLSGGVIAVLDNSEWLLEEASLLVDAKRYERAEFLIATAHEEMGKAYILLDMCRVDLACQQDVLQRLCKSFYDHVLKHVYFDLSANEYAGISQLPEVQYYFHVSAKKWWPSLPESGEPNLPNDVFFLREANLYVDVDSYTGAWMVPRLPSKALLFEPTFGSTPLDKARAALRRLRAAQGAGLLSAEALQVFNGAMRSTAVTENTNIKNLLGAYERAGSELKLSLGIPPETLKHSTLHNWPMYWIRL